MKKAKQKSLGQIAYEAMKWQMPWRSVDSYERRKFGRIARAVEREVLKGSLCLWRLNEFHGCHETQCGRIFALNGDSDLKKHRFRFCPFCGGRIGLVPRLKKK